MHGNVFLTNFLEGKERKLDGAAQKVGRLCVHVHIPSACLPFCQRISRSRQAENRVFTIVRPPHLPNHHLRISWCHNCRLILTSPKTLQNPGTLKRMARTPVTLKRWTTSNVLLLFGRGVLLCTYQFW